MAVMIKYHFHLNVEIKSYQVNRQFEGVIPRMERLYIETKIKLQQEIHFQIHE